MTTVGAIELGKVILAPHSKHDRFENPSSYHVTLKKGDGFRIHVTIHHPAFGDLHSQVSDDGVSLYRVNDWPHEAVRVVGSPAKGLVQFHD